MGEGLRAQAKELERLIGLAQRETSRQLLQAELARVTEALASATTSDPPPAPRPAPAPTPAPMRLSTAPTTAPIEYSSISSYAWDHSNKFVKVYLTIPGLEKIPDAQIEAVFGERSLVLSVAGVSTPPVNRRLSVPTLCHAVREDLCSWVRKPSDMLLIKLRKASDGQEWASLNDSAAKKELQQKERAEANKARAPRDFPRHCMHPSRRSIAGLHRPAPCTVCGRASRQGSCCSRCTPRRTRRASSRSPKRGRPDARSARPISSDDLTVEKRGNDGRSLWPHVACTQHSVARGCCDGDN